MTIERGIYQSPISTLKKTKINKIKSYKKCMRFCYNKCNALYLNWVKTRLLSKKWLPLPQKFTTFIWHQTSGPSYRAGVNFIQNVSYCFSFPKIFLAWFKVGYCAWSLILRAKRVRFQVKFSKQSRRKRGLWIAISDYLISNDSSSVECELQ